MTTAAQTAIITTAQEHMVRLAQDHDLHPWADSEAHARYARQFSTTRFQPLGEHAVFSTTRHGGNDMAANALDFAASVHDEGDGLIVTESTESMVIYYLSTHPDLLVLTAESRAAAGR